MHRGWWKSSFSPESWGCSGRILWEVHCGAWRRAWQSSWASSSALRRSRRRPDSPSRRHGHRCRVYRLPGVAWRHSVGPAGQGLAYICAPAVVGHVAVPDPLGRSANAYTKGSGTTTRPATAGAHVYARPWPAGPTECRHATFGRLYTLQRRPRLLLGLARRRARSP